MNYVELSKEISYALRHRPDEYGLTLDEDGYVFIDDLLRGLNARGHHGRNITKEDLGKALAVSDKQRHEINGDMIRALYGHTVEGKIAKEECIPPDILYHGTTPKAYPRIQEEGLKRMKRQYVHLSPDLETATKVAKRRTDTPVILVVEAKKAYEEGVKFYLGIDCIYLSDDIPSKYLKVLE